MLQGSDLICYHSSAIPRRKSITLHTPQSKSNLGKSCKTSTDWAYAIIRCLLTGLLGASHPSIDVGNPPTGSATLPSAHYAPAHQLSRQHPCLRGGQTGLGRAPLAESSSHDALIGQITLWIPAKRRTSHRIIALSAKQIPQESERECHSTVRRGNISDLRRAEVQIKC